MKKICIVTTTRAEYGLLKLLTEELLRDSYFKVCLVVTGTHLEKEYGYTVQEIQRDGIPIAEQIKIFNGDYSKEGICAAMGRASVLFGEMYLRQKPDCLVVLGDRYELIPICACAVIHGITIAHISGGEITEGAIDDMVRHAVTKMSYFHFVACETYRKRVIQLGEYPNRVFNYGDVGVENIRKMEFLSRKEIEERLGKNLKRPYACVTFHPVTQESAEVKKQMEELLACIQQITNIYFIVTMANADFQGNVINQMWETAAEVSENIQLFESLGSKCYLSLMKDAEFVLGNSSSGIIEAPCFGIPTVNIGKRQNGRLYAESVINCEPQREAIRSAIIRAMSDDFKQTAKKAVNPYGYGDTSIKIVKALKKAFQNHEIQPKLFYDLEWL